MNKRMKEIISIIVGIVSVVVVYILNFYKG